MTTNLIAPLVEYVEDASTVSWPVPFKFLTSAALVLERVTLGVAELLVLNDDYSVSGAGMDAGGSVTMVMAAPVNTLLRITRATPREQTMEYDTSGTFPAKSHETALDKQMLIGQELAVEVGDVKARSMLVPPGESGFVLPAAAMRAGLFLGFGLAGQFQLSAFDEVAEAAVAAVQGELDALLVQTVAERNLARLYAISDTDAAISGAVEPTDRGARYYALLASINGAAQVALVQPLFGSGAPSAGIGSVGQVYYDVGDANNTTLYGPKSGGGWGAGRPLRGLGGAPGGNFLSAVSVAAHAPLINTDTAGASVANKAAFAAAIAAALASGCDAIFVPTGTYWIDAALGAPASSGLYIQVPDNRALRIIGERGTVIKRRGNAAMVATSPLVWMQANTGCAIEWRDIVLDGNEANCAYDAGNIYVHEQSANVKWWPGSGQPRSIEFIDCNVAKNRVGDGYHQNVQVDHFRSTGDALPDTANRRARSDYQFSRYATFATIMSDFEVNSWESEPAIIPATSRVYLANGMTHSVLDLAGDATNAGETQRRHLALRMVNVDCLLEDGRAGVPYCGIWRTKGDIIGCNLRGIRRLQRCKLTIIGGSITTQATPGNLTVARATLIIHDEISEGAGYEGYEDRFDNFVRLIDVRHYVDDGVLTGSHFDFGSIDDGGTTITEFHNNYMERAYLPYFLSGGGAGQVVLRGGRIKATKSIHYFSNSGANHHRITIEDFARWGAPAVLHADFGITVTTGITEININGEFNAETMRVFRQGATDPGNVAIVSAPSVTFNVNATGIVTSDPSNRIRTLPGLRMKLARPVRGQVHEWIAGPPSGGDDSGYNGLTWHRSGQGLLVGSKTYDPASLAAGASVSTAITVTGAALGDFVDSVSLSIDQAGVLVRGYVSAANTVTVYLTNVTAGAVDLASHTIAAIVRKAA